MDSFLVAQTMTNGTWYMADVKHTIEIIEDVFNTTNFEHEIVMYSSSW